jgi:hypothetical protein
MKWAPFLVCLLALLASWSVPPLVVGAAGTSGGACANVLASENVTASADAGDGGNQWGGFQNRIVETSQGVFTVYTTPGQDIYRRTWNLAYRTSSGWQVIASGPSGHEPVSLLASASGRLWIVAWLDGVPTTWDGMPNSNANTGAVDVSLNRSSVPGGWYTPLNTSYGAASIAPDGAVYVLQALGGMSGVSNEWRWARRDPATGTWAYHSTPTGDGRYAYAYLLPDTSGNGLTIIATGANKWSFLGYAQPSGAFGYVFNKVIAARTDDAAAEPPRFSFTTVASEEPTSSYPEPFVTATQSGGMLDWSGRVHVLYLRKGAATLGATEIRHAVIAGGIKVADQVIPGQGNGYVRVTANAAGQLFIIGSSGGSSVKIWPVPDPSQASVGNPCALDIGAQVLYGGLMPAEPRGGTPSSDLVDLGFPSGSHGEVWRYARIGLPPA